MLLIKTYQKTMPIVFKEMYHAFNIYFTFQELDLNVIFEIIPNIYEVFVPEYI